MVTIFVVPPENVDKLELVKFTNVPLTFAVKDSTGTGVGAVSSLLSFLHDDVNSVAPSANNKIIVFYNLDFDYYQFFHILQ